MAELTGQSIPEQTDGISILPTLLGEGEQLKHDYLYHEFVRGNGKRRSARSIRKGNWKAVQIAGNSGDGQIELYNLKEDPGETKNIADQHSEIVANMERLMDEAHIPLK